jgi:ABC-type sugar transport system permease subunit
MNEAVKPKKRKQRIKVRQTVFVYGFLAIVIAHFCLFWVYVNIDSLLLAFRNMEDGREIFTLSNFPQVLNMLRAGDLGAAALNTFKLFVFQVAIFPLGLFYTYFFYKKIRFKSFFRFTFYIPVIVSGVVTSGMFIYLIGADGPVGIIWARAAGQAAPPAFLQQNEYAFNTVLIYDFWMSFSGSILLLGGAMARIPDSIMESARLDGIGWLREMWQICIPMIWPTLSTILVIFSTTIFTASGSTLLLTNGAGNSSTISFWMFVQIKYLNSYYLPSAFGWLMTLLAVPLSLGARKLVNSIYKDVEA